MHATFKGRSALFDFRLWAFEAWDRRPSFRLSLDTTSWLRLGFNFIIDGEDQGFHVSVWAFGLMLTLALEHVIPQWVADRTRAWAERRAELLTARTGRRVWALDLDPMQGRVVTGLSIHFWDEDGGEPLIFARLWEAPCGANNRGWPWNGDGYSWLLQPLSALLGDLERVEEVEHAAEASSIILMEGAYPVTVRCYRSIYRRSRWPLATVIEHAEVKCDGGAPIPGKGENAWDCDEDAIHSTRFAGRQAPWTVDEAVSHFREDVLRARERRGGQGWTPRRRVS